MVILMDSEVFVKMDYRKSKDAKNIKEQYIKYFKKKLVKVFDKRKRLCQDANYKPSEFKKFCESYWWKKANACVHGQFKKIKSLWKISEEDFLKWYLKKMKNGCHYCKQDDVVYALKKNKFPEKGKGAFRRFLEIDRRNSSSSDGYKKSNCVLACYPCNNAKSNVFTEKEFKKIGKTIAKVIKNTK
jgi:hypothetical protein